MKFFTQKLSLIILSLTLSLSLSAQAPKYCGTDEAMKELRAQDPMIAVQEQELEDYTQHFFASNGQRLTLYIIPVVFHIIHNYGIENISDAQVYDAVNILNRDYRMLNADTANIVSPFQSLAADAEIEFRLAKLDPNGNCTNGIDRIVSQETYIGDDGSKLNQWPRNKYLNIWVVNTISSGAAGYSYYPSAVAANAAKDGVMILHNYIGSIGTSAASHSRALTHEIGHWMNLKHCWGDSNNPGVSCGGSDNVSDTPETMGWTSCNLTGSVCNPPIIENIQNYMEYSYCSVMFTTGQKTRMRTALTSATSGRNNLWTTANLTATGISTAPVLCKADFMQDKQVICVGGSIQFKDISWNGNPTSWSWTFAGGTPSTSGDSTPIITYNTPGEYNVTLSVTNGTGSPSITKTNTVIVFADSAVYTNQYSEGFESGSLPNNDWNILNGNGPAWAQHASVGYSGLHSMYINNFSVVADDKDNAYSPPIDLSSIPQLGSLTFRVAYAQKTSGDNDNLKVYLSDNCGQSWILKYNKSGSNLKTVEPKTTAFTPANGTEWRLETISISLYASFTHCMLRFEFTKDGGNNIYIDDINILPANVSVQDLQAADFNLAVFPNPLENNSVISFTLPQQQKVNITVYDVLGREQSVIADEVLIPGDHLFPVDYADLSKGIYFIRLISGTTSVTQKVIVE